MGFLQLALRLTSLRQLPMKSGQLRIAGALIIVGKGLMRGSVLRIDL